MSKQRNFEKAGFSQRIPVGVPWIIYEKAEVLIPSWRDIFYAREWEFRKNTNLEKKTTDNDMSYIDGGYLLTLYKVVEDLKFSIRE